MLDNRRVEVFETRESSWENVIDVLENMSEKSLASQLRKKYDLHLQHHRILALSVHEAAPRTTADAKNTELFATFYLTHCPLVMAANQPIISANLLEREINVNVNWDTLGTYLGLSQGEIRQIESDHQRTERRRVSGDV